MHPTPRHDAQRSGPGTAPATIGAPTWYIEAEAALRDAGRKLECIGVAHPEAARLAGAVFRFASRVRADRLAVAA